MMLKMILGYIAISGMIGALYLISGKLFSGIREKLDNQWLTYEFILSISSLIAVCLLKIFYFESFSIIGTGKLLKWQIVALVIISAFPAAILAFLAKPKQLSNRPLKINITTGMAMEIPMRLLVQNLFNIFGAATVLYGSMTLSVFLTAIIWVQFIIIQEIMMRRPLNLKVTLEIAASIWFSIWAGVLYLNTGSIVVTMITHGIERWIAYEMRRAQGKKSTRTAL